MSYERFKKLKSSSSYKPENPYVKKKEVEPIESNEKTMLEGQYSHIYSMLNNLQREVKFLKEDIASLYNMIEFEEDVEALTPEEARDRYVKFKIDARHFINRTINDRNSS